MKALMIILPLLTSCANTKQNVNSALVFKGNETKSRGPASAIEYLDKSFFLIQDKCYSSIIDMNKGILKGTDVPPSSIVCEPKKANVSFCIFVDSNNKEFARMDMTNMIEGSQAIIASNSGADLVIVNLTSRQIFSSTRIQVDHGRIRGNKTCSGKLIYSHEVSK